MNSIKSPHVLVIDDDEAIRKTLVDMLEINGYRVASAADGREGLALARADWPPQVVITDIAMPHLDGFELLQAFRADEELRSIPVIVISAKADRPAMRRGMELGADDFITKPFSEDEVIHSVQTRLEKKELLDELDAFAHTVAHDLKSPIATLNGRLSLLEMTIGDADEKALRLHLTEATRAAGRLATIINDLLVLSGVRRQHVTPAVLDMGAIVAEALDRIDDLLKRSGAVVEKPTAWPVAVGHPPWVAHIWANYLSNAAKYGGPNPEIIMGAELRDHDRCARFWVQDHGPGLNAAAQTALFVPFTRIATVGHGGYGLGLSIVRRIVEKLGGQVGVESKPGEGARFWFELPTTLAATTPIPQLP